MRNASSVTASTGAVAYASLTRMAFSENPKAARTASQTPAVAEALSAACRPGWSRARRE
jgi:hypothetical protein